MKTAKKPRDRPSSDVRDRKLVHGLGYEGRRLVRTPKRRLTSAAPSPSRQILPPMFGCIRIGRGDAGAREFDQKLVTSRAGSAKICGIFAMQFAPMLDTIP